MDEIRILQLGETDWNQIYRLPEEFRLDFIGPLHCLPEETYNLVFLDRTPSEEEIELLCRTVQAHTLFVTGHVRTEGGVEWLCRRKKARHISDSEIQNFLLCEAKYYYSGSYGEKFNLKDLAVSRGFSGNVRWDGNYCVTLDGEFGEEFRQIAFWRDNTALRQGQSADLWLEYDKDKTVSISVEFTLFAWGTTDHVLNKWEFGETELEYTLLLESVGGDGNLFVSVRARGKGRLRLIGLHKRLSRGKHGYFLPGGERYVTSGREELFCYFDPGDLKPPLAVYFSGWKTKQGFEGYYLMKGMGCPFLLIAEPRLEGGAFYMGSEEYEKMYVDCIKKHMEELGFTSGQTVLSGLSMGTYGALYYGCDIGPHALILGKPLTNIGDVAAHEKYLRPGGFPTSLDVLRYQCGGMDLDGVKRLNDKFWNKFDAADWGNSKFVISYMIEDDYDDAAYQMLLSHLRSGGVQLYGKGIHGRHNDNSAGIVSWFTNQYKKILREDFARGTEER